MFNKKKLQGTIKGYDYYNEIISANYLYPKDHYEEGDDYERTDIYDSGCGYYFRNVQIEFEVDGRKCCKSVKSVWSKEFLKPGDTILFKYDLKNQSIIFVYT